MIVLTGVLYWLLTDASFRVSASSVVFEGLRYADEAAVRDQLSGLEREPNVFRVRASEIASDLLVLPEVASAAATVTLPARVSVRIEERQPVFTWQDGETAWLVDEEGMLFAPVPLVAADLGDGSDAAAVPAASPRATRPPCLTPDRPPRPTPDRPLHPPRRHCRPTPRLRSRSWWTHACPPRRRPSARSCRPTTWPSCASCWP